MTTDSQWLNVQDVAEMFQIKDETVRRWIRRRELPVLELGGPRAGYRIRREDLDHFIWQRYRSRTQGDDESEPHQRIAATVDSDSVAREQGDETPQPGPKDYLSLMSRIPGITYISRPDPEVGGITRRRIVSVSADFEKLLGEPASALIETDQRWWNRVHPDDRERVDHARRESCQTGKRLSIEYRVADGSGQDVWVRDEAVLGDDSGGDDPVWQGIILNVTERKIIEDNLRARMRQHAAIAELGEHALRETDVDRLFDEAVALVDQNLHADYIKILELQPGGHALTMRAGIGWKPDPARYGTVSSGSESQAGYTLLSNEPVIVDDLPAETRFTGPPLLLEHGVRSGISVIITGDGKPWGVFGAHSTRVKAFTVGDLTFLQSVANVVASVLRSANENQTGPKWLTIKDVADILRVKEETVRRWIRRGELPIIDLGSSRAGYRVHPTDLDYFIHERYMKP